MITKHIVVEPFDEHWRLDFLKIQNELMDALGQLAIRIEHVGSTSVQGLSAKPIVDIDVVIKDYNVLKDTISALEKIGYQYEGDLGIPGREAFRYDGKDHLKKHHLYVCPADLCVVGKLLQISRSYVSRLETHALEQLRKGWLPESPGE